MNGSHAEKEKKKVATSFADLEYEHFCGIVNTPVCEIQ